MIRTRTGTTKTPNTGDQFCIWYDELDPALVVNKGAKWVQKAGFQAEITATCEEIVIHGRLPTSSGSPSTEAEHRSQLARLLGIDRAFKHIHPIYAGASVPPELLLPERTLYRKSQRYNANANLGALIPRLTLPDPVTEQIEELQLAFRFLQRVSPDACKHIARDQASPRQRVTARDRQEGLTVACVSALADANDLDVEIIKRNKLRHYRISVRDTKDMTSRISAIVSELDGSGVELAIAPELSSSPALVEHWSQVLAGAGRSRDSRLRWVLAGTGSLGTSKRPTNTAVLLDGQTGAEILQQMKQYRFNIAPAQQKDYAFSGFDQTDILHEDIDITRTLSVLELGALRVAVLICEDLTRHDALLGEIHANGISLLIVPIFSKPTVEWRWEHQGALKYAQLVGSVVVVGNSLPVGRLKQPTGNLAASLVTTPEGTVIQGVALPTELMRFVVRDGEKPQPLDRVVT